LTFGTNNAKLVNIVPHDWQKSGNGNPNQDRGYMSILTQFPTNEETRRQKMLLKAFGEAFARICEARSLDIPEENRAEWIDGFNHSRESVHHPLKSRYFDMGFWDGKKFMGRFFCNER
jgi:hypothetical protein